MRQNRRYGSAKRYIETGSYVITDEITKEKAYLAESRRWLNGQKKPTRAGFFRSGYSSSASRSGTISISICTVLISWRADDISLLQKS